MSKHTKGPWKLEEFDSGWAIETATGDYYIADVLKSNDANTHETIDAANARLIAAAPELLEALKQLQFEVSINHYSYEDDDDKNSSVTHRKLNEALKKAMGAIAKAEGSEK